MIIRDHGPRRYPGTACIGFSGAQRAARSYRSANKHVIKNDQSSDHSHAAMGPDVEGRELLQILQDVGRVAPPHAELAGRTAGTPGGVAIVLAGRRRRDRREEEGDEEGQPRRHRPDERISASTAHVVVVWFFGGAFPAVVVLRRGARTAAIAGHGFLCLWDPRARAQKSRHKMCSFFDRRQKKMPSALNRWINVGPNTYSALL